MAPRSQTQWCSPQLRCSPTPDHTLAFRSRTAPPPLSVLQQYPLNCPYPTAASCQPCWYWNSLVSMGFSSSVSLFLVSLPSQLWVERGSEESQSNSFKVASSSTSSSALCPCPSAKTVQKNSNPRPALPFRVSSPKQGLQGGIGENSLPLQIVANTTLLLALLTSSVCCFLLAGNSRLPTLSIPLTKRSVRSQEWLLQPITTSRPAAVLPASGVRRKKFLLFEGDPPFLSWPIASQFWDGSFECLLFPGSCLPHNVAASLSL